MADQDSADPNCVKINYISNCTWRSLISRKTIQPERLKTTLVMLYQHSADVLLIRVAFIQHDCEIHIQGWPTINVQERPQNMRQ